MSGHKPAEYRHIAAWGRLMHSDGSYIRDQQARAASDGAPLDAIYREYAPDGSGPLPGHWYLFSGVRNAETRALVERFLAEVAP